MALASALPICVTHEINNLSHRLPKAHLDDFVTVIGPNCT